MLRMVPFKSAARAREYYTQALVKEDYWSRAAGVLGMWAGKIAERLGITGEVKSKIFEALSLNKHPETEERITARNRKGRIVGFDMNFGVPKSVSILYAFTGDQKIIDVILEANQKMMEAIERDTETRVRLGGVIEDRKVGNLVYATFLHHTGRPVGGIPDPHLHTHNFVMNMCYDDVEGRYKSIKFGRLKQNAPYYEAVGRSYLAKGLEDLGYSVSKVNKAFEIIGLSRTLIQKYSRRTMQIDQLVAELGIEDAKARDKVGAISRESKKSSLTAKQTLGAWVARLDDDEKRSIQEVIRNRGLGEVKTITASQAVDYAMAHCFERKSVVKKRDLFREAIAYGYGALLPRDISREIDSRNLITGRIRGVEHCTSQSVLNEEKKIIRFVRNGKARFLPFASRHYQITRSFLSGEQIAAVRDILSSRNQVVGLQGGAGVGKTTSMQEVVDAIEHTGKRVFAFAPTHKARDTLKKDGFNNAATLKSLLNPNNAKLQRSVRGQVILLDEAGMVGSEDMLNLFRVAGNDTRIILAGDVRQHSSVDRGEPFRILQKYKVLGCASISTIIRQKEGYYRDAAQALANGDVESAFGYLDAMNAIVEIESKGDRYNALATEYVASLNAGDTPLLISPTHAEGWQVTQAIRTHLQQVGKLGEDHNLMQLSNLQWSDAEKSKAELYREGYMVQFHQNAKGYIVRGSRFTVTGHDDSGNVLVSDEKGKSRVLDVGEAKKFQVYQNKGIKLANGDLIRMTRNDSFADGRRYYRGQVYQISRIYPSGSIKLKNGALLKKDYGHIQHGYVSTSHASQSISHDAPVFLVQSAKSFAASSLNQFNVSVTRGKNDFYLYTDNVGKLKDAVKSYQHSLTATEFANKSSLPFVCAEENRNEPFPYDVTGKEREVMFNGKGEFRYTPGSARHDVGGSFADYVTARRRRAFGDTSELDNLRKDYVQGNKNNGWNQAIAEKQKHWKTYLASKPKHGIGTAIKKGKSGLTVTGSSLKKGDRQKDKPKSFTAHLDKARSKSMPLGEAIKEGKFRSGNVVAKPESKKSNAKVSAKNKVKNVSKQSEAKGKNKGKAKGVKPPSPPKPPPPPPPPIKKR